MSDPRIGEEVAGYRIEAMIGRGGMGVVYRAEDIRLGRKVALKLLAPELATNDDFRVRFESESRAAAAIDHPNIIPLYEANEADGLLFLTMRFVDGLDLKALLEREGPLPLARAIAIIAQVGSALDAAHARGLVHRDVKPANVLVASGEGPEASDHCYLTDFGLTKDTASGVQLTAAGQFVGTIAYVAPEQIDGETQSGATDQYALGCMFYECLTGKQPFERDTELDVMWAHLNEEPPLATEHRPDLPPAIDDVLSRAMAKAPEDRHRTCTALVLAARGTLSKPTAVGRTVVSPSQEDAGQTRLSSRPAGDGAGATTVTPAPSVAGGSAVPAADGPVPVPARGSRGRAGFVIAAVVAAVAAAAAGVVVGGGGDSGPPAAENVAATGGLSLRFPASWETLASPPSIPGLNLQSPIAIGPRASGGREGLVAGRISSSGTRLLSERLAPPDGAKPAPRDAVRLGGADAFRYANLRPAGFTGAVTVYVLLTDRGRTAIACYASAPSAAFATGCADRAGSLELRGAKALALAPSAAYARALGGLLAGVARDRDAGRQRIAAAKTSRAQAGPAAALAATYRIARRRARALPAPPAARAANDAIAAALGDAAQALAGTATAARGHDSSRYRASGRALRQADKALREAVGGLAELGYDVGS